MRFIITMLLVAAGVAAAPARQTTRPFSGHEPDHPLNVGTEEWLRILAGPDVEARRQLLAATGGAYKMDLSALRPALLRALADPDDYVRLQAAATMGRNDQAIPPGPPADETRKAALRAAGEQGRNRSVAIEALGAFADQSEEAVQELIRLAVGRDWNAAQTAARVASHATDAAVAALTNAALDAADLRHRLMIYNALGQAPRERRSAATDALFRALPRDDSDAFFTGIKSLMHLDRQRLLDSDLLKGTLPRYLAALQPPEKANGFAAMTVGLLGADAAPAIPHLVRHAVWVEHESTGSVEQKGWGVFPVEVGVGFAGAAAVGPLLSCLGEDDPRTRKQAAKLLLTLLHAEGELLSDNRRDKEERGLRPGEEWPTPGGRPSPEVVRNVGTIVRLLEQERQSAVRKALAEVLGAMGTKAAAGAPVLLRIAESDEFQEATAAVFALRHVAPETLHEWPSLPRLRDRLVRALDDRRTRYRAISALGALRADAAGATLPMARALASDVDVPDFPVLVLDIKNAVRHIGLGGVPGLVAALEDSDARVRRTALALLAAFEPAPPEAVAAAQRALSDSDPAVRDSAEVALRLMEAGPN